MKIGQKEVGKGPGKTIFKINSFGMMVSHRLSFRWVYNENIFNMRLLLKQGGYYEPETPFQWKPSPTGP
jgi:hypothetical protein